MASKDSASDQLLFYVNGKKIVERNVDPEHTLVWYLRTKLRLVGTKVACGQGGCGSCTVMISERLPEWIGTYQNGIRHYSAMACLTPLCTLHGKAVTTVEGVGNTWNKLHPVQERIAKAHGVQCGFCSPGMVMSLYALLRNNPKPTMKMIQTALQGNLCRCTGYRSILSASASFAEEYCGMGENCCKRMKTESDGNIVVSPTFDPSTFSKYDPTQDPIFPSELMLTDYRGQSRMFQGAKVTYHQTADSQEVFALLKRYPDARVIGGCTAIAHELQKGSVPVVINISMMEKLREVKPVKVVLERNQVTLGAMLTLSELEAELKNVINSIPDGTRTKSLRALEGMLGRIGASQIRNIGTIAGNIGSGNSKYDLASWLAAAGCRILPLTKDPSEASSFPIDMDYHDHHEDVKIYQQIILPLSNKNQYYRMYKHSKRPEFDWSVLSSGMRVTFKPGTETVEELMLAFSNLGFPVWVAKKTCSKAIGRKWDESLLSDLQTLLTSELDEITKSQNNLTPFKKTLAKGFIHKFFYSVKAEMESKEQPSQQYDSELSRGRITATQVFEEVPEGQSMADAVGRPIVHQAAFESTTGEARFADDIPPFEDEVHVVPILSTKAHANILGVDPSAALSLPGVVCFLNHEDVPGLNLTGFMTTDAEVFVTKKVLAEGNVIGAIVAEDRLTAKKAATIVKVDYEELKPVLTIEDAMALDPNKKTDSYVNLGNVEEGFASADHVLEGELSTGAQEHFYMETMSGIAVPREQQEMELIGSVQAPMETQTAISRILGLDRNRININTKRMGGSFGGKQCQIYGMWGPCVVAAKKLRRPARCILTREEDMINTGKKHPFYFKYKVGFSKEGRLIAVDVGIHLNGGYSIDESPLVLEIAILNFEQAYKIPNLRMQGYVWYTNTFSNTAFRGFGGNQALLCMETILDEVGRRLGVAPEEVRQVNMFKEGDETFSRRVLNNCTIRECWQKCQEVSDFKKKRDEFNEFNSEHIWKKRGIAMTNTKFPLIAIGLPWLNQGAALLNVYLDGTVLIHHGGVEMGQGLHTKCIQVASRALGIPSSQIHISASSTYVVPNPSCSAGSQSTDMFGGAVMDGCGKLMKKLEPYKDKNPNGTWKDWVEAAYKDQVNLSTTGFYKTPGVTFDWDTGIGQTCEYFTYGTACSQVEVDCLTGEHKILRTDIVMDLGRSLNPAIDIGQIEGGFMMGYGLYVMEEMLHTPGGNLITKGPHNYKIPSISTIPEQFNVTILKGVKNEFPKAIYSAKGTGEPPMLLAASVFMAIKDAIMAKRRENGLTEVLRLNAPATSEKIRMACGDIL